MKKKNRIINLGKSATLNFRTCYIIIEYSEIVKKLLARAKNDAIFVALSNIDVSITEKTRLYCFRKRPATRWILFIISPIWRPIRYSLSSLSARRRTVFTCLDGIVRETAFERWSVKIRTYPVLGPKGWSPERATQIVALNGNNTYPRLNFHFVFFDECKSKKIHHSNFFPPFIIWSKNTTGRKTNRAWISTTLFC